MGRLDHLVEAVYDRFKDRYFRDESAFVVFSCAPLSIRPRKLIITWVHIEVYVDVQGDKCVLFHFLSSWSPTQRHLPRFFARVVEVFPPRPPSPPKPDTTPVASTSSQPPPSPPKPPCPPIHNISGDLKVPAKEVNATDDPQKYYYKVQLLEEEKSESARDKMAAYAKEARAKWTGSLMEVQCPVMRYVPSTVTSTSA